MAKNLNNIFYYTKIKPVKYRKIDIAKLKSYHVMIEDDWSLSEFSSLKRYVRYSHYKIQKRKCAYCRRTLNPLGINEHLDHLVARSIKARWMFKPRNLVLSCYQCNTQKSASSIIAPGVGLKRLPKKSSNYVLFNPYVHNWSDHFEIEDGIFLKAKSIEGENTIKELKMYDHKYAMIYAELSGTFNDSGIKKATKRLITFPKGSVEYRSAKKLIEEINWNRD